MLQHSHQQQIIAKYIDTILILLILVNLVLSTGCTRIKNLDYSPNRDIVVVKLTPNATMEWSRVIDLGGDDQSIGLMNTPDNNFVIFTGINNQMFTGMMKITPDNRILFNESLSERNCIPSVTGLGRNGDIIVAMDNVCRINTDGDIVSNHPISISGFIKSIAETTDNGYVVGGAQYIGKGDRTETMIAKIDKNGSVTWQTFLGKYDYKDPVELVFQLPDDQGYVAQTNRDVIRLDRDGNFVSVQHLNYEVPESDNGTINGESLTRYLTYSPGTIFYNQSGFAVAKLILHNAIGSTSRTSDNGYISADVRNSQSYKITDNNLHVVKLHQDGTIEWDRNVSGILINGVSQIIQTSEGGYIVVGEYDKEWEDKFRD
jgi:hypothetical protein